jgi:glycosyltransferase involved in cell wall biosynthesis
MGLVPIEANAAGCPVIAYGKGGVLDTIKENVTGLFFDEQTPASLMDALDRFEKMEAEGAFNNRDAFSDHVRRFSREAFKEKVLGIIDEKKRL